MRYFLRCLWLALDSPKNAWFLLKLKFGRKFGPKNVIASLYNETNGVLDLEKKAPRLKLKDVCQRKIQELNAVPLEIQEPKILEKILSQKTRLYEIQKRL